MDRANELIERYLDDVATAAERAELAALLTADPAVADALARATRVDARLRELAVSGAGPQAPDRAAGRQAVAGRRSWKGWAAVAAGLVLLGGLLGAVLLVATRRPGPPPQAAPGPPTPRESGTARSEGPPDVVGRVEGLSAVTRRLEFNGVEKVVTETRLSLVVRGGPSAAKGSRLTVLLTEGTRTAGVAPPAPGDEVRVWLAPGTVDRADYVEVVHPK